MSTIYAYVGPEEIRRKHAGSHGGFRIKSQSDVSNWLAANGLRSGPGEPAVTFVVDRDGTLRIADRRSEHVACAGGEPVLSAGEMFFGRTREGLQVVEVSNYSTGYCPEPESWPAVADALEAADIDHPGGFTTTIVFRLCGKCGQRNVVKDDWFVCAVCGTDLPSTWNFGLSDS